MRDIFITESRITILVSGLVGIMQAARLSAASPRLRQATVLCAAAILFGCAPGDDSNDPPAQPQVDVTAPTTPANLVATPTSASRVDLTWTASTDSESGVASYRIFRNGSATALATVSTTNYADMTVVANTAYTYQVRAVDVAGNISNASNTANATTPAPPVDVTAPTVPANLVATPTSATRVDLNWTASTDSGSGVAGYRVYRNGSATALATVTATTYADTAVSANTAYTYVVRAIDVAGNLSNASNTANVTTPSSSPTSGLDTRPSNTTCLAWDRPTAGNSISLTRVFGNLPNFSSPIAMLQAPGNSSRWFIVQQGGVVRVFDNVAVPSAASTFIDIDARVDNSQSEMGLLGMAFHPNFPTDPRVFLSYTNSTSSLVSSFRTLNGGTTLDPGTEQVVLNVELAEDNHNGGHIAFGPDGFLYFGTGDGGGSNDNHGAIGNSQRLTTMLGKMLRIDVNATPAQGETYVIPSSNPYAGNAVCLPAGRPAGNTVNCPEIYAYGLRNPWRWNFDRQNNDLWIADVGQGAYEEVNQVTIAGGLGGNFGWRCREGVEPTNLACGTPGTMIDPVAVYGRSLGASITGGYVYRGSQNTNLFGRFIFGDFISGRIFAWIPGGAVREPTQLLDANFNISSFGQGNDGELYVVAYSGELYRIVFQAGAGGGVVPNSLAGTGCTGATITQPASGLIPYGLNAPFWSDGANKDRYIGLPPGQNIEVQSDGDWNFPSGSVLVKNFRIGTQLIETRLLMRHPNDGSWSGYTYAWDAQQTAATRVEGGDVRTVGNNQQWIFPSEAECMQCHTSVAGRALGPETAQLNRDFQYPTTGRTANQLTTHNFIQTLSPPLAGTPSSLPSMPDPADTNAPLANRARAYLHTNCSQCHRPGSGIAQMDLRYSATFAATNTCGVSPQSGDVGLGVNARLIVPGNAALSIIPNRMNRRDANAMPPLGSNAVDTAGVTLINQWINSLNTCN